MIIMVWREPLLPNLYTTRVDLDKMKKSGNSNWEGSNGYGGSTLFLKPEHLDSSASCPSPMDVKGGALWCQAMSGLPLAGGISCWPMKAVALHCPGKVYIERPGCLGVGYCCYNMGDLTEEVKEEESEIEIDSVNLEEQTSSARVRQRILISQMAWTVRRSDYPTHVLSLHPPPKTHPAPAWHKPSSRHSHCLKVLLH